MLYASFSELKTKKKQKINRNIMNLFPNQSFKQHYKVQKKILCLLHRLNIEGISEGIHLPGHVGGVVGVEWLFCIESHSVFSLSSRVGTLFIW